ncbi:MAG: tetratricopeptide repeat protein [Alistipes sp.]|nr:tetratricopeptide repeat protein [Alistipes sp.]
MIASYLVLDTTTFRIKSLKLRRFILVILFIICATTSVVAQYNRDYFFYVGRKQMMDNDFKEAIRTLNVLLRFDENAYEGYFLRGIAKYNLDDLLGAEADFSTAIEKNPVFTTAFTYRAITRSRLGNYDDALNDFREAIELRPDLPNPYYSRGVTRLLNQQFKEAIEDFDNFIRYEKKVADAYINRGICHLYLKDTVRAYADFDLGIRTNRESPTGYNRRGALLMQQERFEEAEKDFDMAVKCDTTLAMSYFNRALVYNETNRPMQSLADLDRVIQLDSTSSITYFNRAIIRYRIGDYNRSLEDYNKVAEYSPDNVLVYYNRAILYQQLGEIERAKSDYTKAIELYPDFANAYLGRSYLRHLLRDYKGARSDKQIAERKIAEYKSRLNDTTYSIYADTTRRYDKLLSFESKIAGSSFERITSRRTNNEKMALLPLFKFTFTHDSTVQTATAKKYHSQRAADFIAQLNNPLLVISCRESNIAPDSLVAINRRYKRGTTISSATFEELFNLAISESLVKQYTNAVTTYTSAIKLSPTNPFVYLNRAATQAEMIDFISSIENAYQRISIESDPARQLHNRTTRTYNYDEAIADLTKAIKLNSGFAYTYYNRANLLALSGKLPEAYDDYSKAIELNPHFAEAYYNRGLIQIYMKDTRKGCLDISKAGELGIEEAYEVLKQYTKQ